MGGELSPTEPFPLAYPWLVLAYLGIAPHSSFEVHANGAFPSKVPPSPPPLSVFGEGDVLNLQPRFAQLDASHGGAEGAMSTPKPG